MKKFLAALLVVSIFLSGCLSGFEPASELPEDFELHYATGAMHKEWGVFYFDVDSQGNAVFTKTQGFDQEEELSAHASKEELLAIYNSALANGFFALQDEYQDPSIMDGGWDEITIKAGGLTKTVNLQNYDLEEFTAIETEINRLIISKLGEGAFSMK
jgi:hypothetical protein